jgi:hypothetical protein
MNYQVFKTNPISEQFCFICSQLKYYCIFHLSIWIQSTFSNGNIRITPCPLNLWYIQILIVIVNPVLLDLCSEKSRICRLLFDMLFQSHTIVFWTSTQKIDQVLLNIIYMMGARNHTSFSVAADLELCKNNSRKGFSYHFCCYVDEITDNFTCFVYNCV